MQDHEGSADAPGPWRAGSAREVLLAFLKLGLSCFGGPIAHLGYFHGEFVIRRRWLDEQAYAELVALCQCLPGPASSQVGAAIGLMRAGYRGGLAAWVGFTAPSALLMVAFAYGAAMMHGPSAAGMLHGLRLVAVAIVAQAVWGMARAHCGDGRRRAIAAAAALFMLAVTASWAQLATIAMGALAGVLWCRAPEGIEAGRLELPVSRRIGIAALGAFLLLLVALPLARSLHPTQAVALVDACYRSGALVFGGGHVVLPLLRQAFVGTGWVTDEVFLNGYGAAQALPGPLFSFAAYLGASVRPAPHGWAGAALGLAALYLPGMLILIGALPFWQTFSRQANARAALRGVNAAVVGLLAAALYNPVWTNSVHAPADAGVVLIGFLMLMVWRAPPLLVVACGALAGLSLTRFVP